MTSTVSSAPADVLASRPALRPEIVIGPGLVQGTRTVHHLKDPRTGWYFQVGPREAYIAGRLDGTRTLQEIGIEYAMVFGRRVDRAGWEQLLGMLAARRLLVGSSDQDLAEMATAARDRGRAGRSLLRARLPLVAPDHFLAWLAPRLGPLFSGWVVVPAALVVVAVEIAVLWNARDLAREAAGMWEDPFVGAALVAIFWITLALHETAHGLTCRRFGGRVPEIGVMWRFPLLFPYCKVDDVMLFATRRQRVLTAFAGVYTTLVLLVPVALVHPWLDPGPVRAASAGLLLYGSVAALVNLVPFLQLDGYFMLNHALGMVDLRSESYRYLGQVGRSLLRRPGATTAGYPRRLRWIYGGYGLASIAFGLALAVGVLGYWLGQVWERYGAGAVFAWIAVAAASVAVWWYRRRRQRFSPGVGRA